MVVRSFIGSLRFASRHRRRLGPGGTVVRTYKSLQLSSFFLLASMISCGGGGGSGQGNQDAGDSVAPTLVSTSPADHATNVPVNSTVSATFSEGMNVSVLEGAVQIAPTVDGAMSYSGTTVMLTPRSPLAYATTYTVTIT